jgi:hypothetical protein
MCAIRFGRIFLSPSSIAAPKEKGQRFRQFRLIDPHIDPSFPLHSNSCNQTCAEVDHASVDSRRVCVLAVSRCQSGRLDLHLLDMFIPLLGDRRAHHLVGRALLGTAQAAVADGLLDRPEA